MIKIVITQVGIVIGEKINNETMLQLKNPRLMQPRENNQFQLVELIGHPKGIEIGKECANWDVTDESLINTYKEATTGLTLVKHL